MNESSMTGVRGIYS